MWPALVLVHTQKVPDYRTNYSLRLRKIMGNYGKILLRRPNEVQTPQKSDDDAEG